MVGRYTSCMESVVFLKKNMNASKPSELLVV